MASSKRVSDPTTTDLNNWDKKSIHLLGKIQSHGGVLTLNNDWMIAYRSASNQSFFDQEPEQLLDAPLKHGLDIYNLHQVRSALQSSLITGDNERLFGIKVHTHQQKVDMQKELNATETHHVSVVGNVRPAQQTCSRRKPGRVVFVKYLGNKTTPGFKQPVIEDNNPCLIISGYGEQLQLSTEFSTVPVLIRPAQEPLLAETLHALLSNPDPKPTGHAE